MADRWRWRGVLTLTLGAGLLVSCSDDPPERDRADRTPTPSASPTPTASAPAAPSEGGPVLPALPATDSAPRLAAQLDRAFEVLLAREARPADVRRAAELQQLAVRALATGPPAFRREVVGLLDRQSVPDTRADIGAGRRLLSMLSEPARTFPRWRVVQPPAAPELLAHYRRAQRRTGVHWSYLAAIHLVETRMGRIRGVSTAGAVGPMQFLPTTWDLYGAGGDIRDPGDAILAAGRLLAAHGAPGDMAGALWHYNPSDAYVEAVQSYARTMRRSPTAYRRYWHWRVLYTHRRGTYVLPVGYPRRRPVLVPERSATSRGTVPPAWLGTRVLPRTAEGFGEVRPTPAVMRVRRWNTPDSVPALPGTGFRALVAAPAPVPRDFTLA